MEELAQNEKQNDEENDANDGEEENAIILNRGPFAFEDTLEFGTIYKTENKIEYKMYIKKLPDARTQKIITDFS